MAAAIIPLVAPLALPLVEAGIQELLPLIIRGIDKIFPPKSGAVKLTVSSNIWTAVLSGLASSKAIAAIPGAADIVATVQGVVNDQKNKGLLNGPATVVVQPGAPATTPQHVLTAAAGVQLMLQGFLQVVSMQTALP